MDGVNSADSGWSLQEAVLRKLKEISKDPQSRELRGIHLGEIADTALAIRQFRPIEKLQPLVVSSCEAAYSAIAYTECVLKNEVDESIATETRFKLKTLLSTLNKIRELGDRIITRDPVLAVFMRCFGFWESRKIHRLRAALKDMIINDFWPKDWNRSSIRDKIAENEKAFW